MSSMDPEWGANSSTEELEGGITNNCEAREGSNALHEARAERDVFCIARGGSDIHCKAGGRADILSKARRWCYILS